jgi:hypothetical protein
MIRQTLLLAILTAAFDTNAACLTDPPEIGDIGPSSELVCNALERRFPKAASAVEGRAIHSPTAVSVAVTVDGEPMTLRYGLSGYAWRLDETDVRVAGVPGPCIAE